MRNEVQQVKALARKNIAFQVSHTVVLPYSAACKLLNVDLLAPSRVIKLCVYCSGEGWAQMPAWSSPLSSSACCYECCSMSSTSSLTAIHTSVAANARPAVIGCHSQVTISSYSANLSSWMRAMYSVTEALAVHEHWYICICLHFPVKQCHCPYTTMMMSAAPYSSEIAGHRHHCPVICMLHAGSDPVQYSYQCYNATSDTPCSPYSDCKVLPAFALQCLCNSRQASARSHVQLAMTCCPHCKVVTHVKHAYQVCTCQLRMLYV